MGFHIDQWIQASSIWKNDGIGAYLQWSASYTTQGAQMPRGRELSKYLIGKISSMYVRQRKPLWNKYFPQSVKTWASEDLNSSIGTDGLKNTFSLPKVTQTFSVWRLIQKCDVCLVILPSHSPHFFLDHISHLFRKNTCFSLIKVNSSGLSYSVRLST